MATEQVMYRCKRCDESTVHLRQTPSHLLHLILTIVTFGFWLPVWILLSLGRSSPQCSECGKKRGPFGLW